MTILSQLNSPVMYLICGGIIAFVALVCVFFAVRAWKAGVAIGMDKTKMKRAVVSSATFAVLPSVGILLGVIALAGSLGTPWPWLRLLSSVRCTMRRRWPRLPPKPPACRALTPPK